MATSEDLRQDAKDRIDHLTPRELRVAAEFLHFLQDRASEEATAELLKIPRLVRDLKQAEKDRRAGKGRSWRGLRKDV
jgi:hypothetical protein